MDRCSWGIQAPGSLAVTAASANGLAIDTRFAEQGGNGGAASAHLRYRRAPPRDLCLTGGEFERTTHAHR
jgi:hypothetical protein